MIPEPLITIIALFALILGVPVLAVAVNLGVLAWAARGRVGG